MTLVARPAAPLLIELTPGPGQTLQSVNSVAYLVHESMLKTSAGCRYGPTLKHETLTSLETLGTRHSDKPMTSADTI